MPPPDYTISAPEKYRAGLRVYRLLWDLARDGDEIDLEPGEYRADMTGRWQPEHHEYSDGYIYAVYRGEETGQEAVVGYQWQQPLQCFVSAEGEVDDLDELLDYDEGRPEALLEESPAFEIGQRLKLQRPVLDWGWPTAIQNYQGCEGTPVDVPTVEIVDIFADSFNENEYIEEDDFYMYQARCPDGALLWTTEMALEDASSE